MKKYFIPLWIFLIAIISIVTLRAVLTISDIPARVSFILAHQAGTADLPSNFLYYWMIEFLSFFSTNSSFISNTIVYFAFPLFFIFRSLATLVLGRYFFSETLKSLSAKNAIQIEVISFLLLFAHAIPIFYFLQISNTFFLGYLSGTVWHNETIMSTMVFAVFTYLFMLKQLKDLENIKRITTLSIILVIGILLKPSFFFSMAPSFGLFLLFAIFKKRFP